MLRTRWCVWCAGFTLIEIAVAVAVLAILSAIILATVTVERGRSRISESAEILTGLVSAVRRFDSATGSPTTGRHPLLLSHLTNEITNVNTAGCPLCRNSCGSGAAPPAQSLYSAGNVTGWRAAGPFYPRDVVYSVGLRIPIGLVRDTLHRIPATAGSASLSFARLQMRVDSVALLDAQDLDERVDGVASSTSGAVTWTAIPDADGMLSSISWTMPITGC